MSQLGNLFIVSLVIFLTAAPVYPQASGADTLDAVVISVNRTDSTLVARAGLSQGVYPETEGIVYLPFTYMGAEHKNRIARCLVKTVEDSTCLMKIIRVTAYVRPNYRIMLYNLRKPLEEFAAAPRTEPRSKPFYKRKWFWIAGGTAATAAILAATRGSSGSKSNRGTIVISGSLP